MFMAPRQVSGYSPTSLLSVARRKRRRSALVIAHGDRGATLAHGHRECAAPHGAVNQAVARELIFTVMALYGLRSGL